MQIEGPEGASDRDLYQVALNNSPQSFASAEDRGMADPAQSITGTQRFLAGAGKAFTDIGRGARQLLGIGNQDALQAEVMDSRTRDAALMNTGAGLAGNITGGMAAAIPAAFVPGANTYTGAALTGSVLGALAPTAGNESRLTNTALGGALGAAGQGIGNVIGRVIRPIRSSLSQEGERLAAEAARRNIPLTAGQRTGSKPIQIAESVMENLPSTAGRQVATKQATREAYNRAIARTFGSDADAITPEVLGDARRRIGNKFSELAARNVLNADDELMVGLAQLETEAKRNLTPDVGRVVLNRIDDVLERISDGKMAGTAYRNLDSELGRAARNTANGDLRNAVGQLRSTLRGAMDRSISETDKAAWNEARRQYANLMTVAPLAAGDVSGRTLLSAANAANRNARFGAQSELAELGRIGRAFVSDQIPNSGTAQRQFVQSLLTAGGGTGAGAIAASATGNDPMQGALYGLGVTGMGLLAPRLIQGGMLSAPGRAYLTRGILPITEAQQFLLNAGMRSALPVGVLSNLSQ